MGKRKNKDHKFDVPGTVFTTAIMRFRVELKEIDKPVPENEQEGFCDWILSLPVLYGVGMFNEYYRYTLDYRDDIGVLVKITLLKT